MNRASRYLANVTFLTFVRVIVVAFCVCICHYTTLSDGKIFERCELAQVLRYGHGLDVNDVANWVCIAQHSSSLNTSAFGGNARSGSHGIFQISDQYWCSPPGKGIACGLTCDKLRDDDIGDDLECARIIYEEHQRLSGDGYNAWIAYQTYCRENPYEYIEDCFGNEEREYLHSKSIAANYVEDENEEEDVNDPYSKKRGKVYGRCELAKELFLKHKMPMEEIPTWVCIAQHESNYDTSAVGRLNTDGSADHGLFQISDLFWCSHKGGRRKACGLSCSKLLDSDITDDVKCVKQIYKEHTHISGDGFTAWTVYNAYCHGNVSNYVRGCFDGIDISQSNALEELRKPTKSQKPHGKVYEPCELAEELRSKHHLPEDQIATWVCIAKHESDYNTSAIGYGDHGLFQISDIYWCSPPGKGFACGLSCADLEDSDISDDVKCIRQIFDEHTHLTGDGFNAWTVYPHYCSEGRAEKYIADCPGNHPKSALGHLKLSNPNSIEDDQPKIGKIYGRCELAKELRTKFEMSMKEVPIWVCIAHHESNYDTSAVGRLNIDGSADHGLFQISDLYWCSHKDGLRKACGIPCNKLLDNDITDDVECIKRIHNEHTKISGDGFNAWTVYNAYCNGSTEPYIRGCFDGSVSEEDFNSIERTIDPGFPPKNKPKGKVYEECELANELRDKHRIPKDEISTWVCIAKHQSALNTSSAVSNVHGMFHISDEYWCSPPGKGKVCELNCADLEDSDISDDVECIKKIYLEHQRLFGNGFSAWVVYSQHCSNGEADDYIGHCPGFESPTRNAISYNSQHQKLADRFNEISNKPVYNHAFNANPFLKHFEMVNSEAAAKIHSDQKFYDRSNEISNKPVYDHGFSENPFLKYFEIKNSEAAAKIFLDSIEESFNTGEEVGDTSPATPDYSLNPFLTNLKAENKAPFGQEKTTESYFKTTPKPPVNLITHIAPTPTRANRLETYQPKNEEQAKYEAFKSLATPSLPSTTQTPRIDRLQSYQLNTFRPFATPVLPVPTTHVPTTNRLQPYQLNTFNSFRTISTPTKQPLSTKIPTLKPPVRPALPTAQFESTTKPVITPTTRTVSQNSGQYDPAKYDSGQYDSGRYDPGRYDPGRYDPRKYNPSSPKIVSNIVSSRVEIKSPVQFPAATFTPTSISISSELPVIAPTQQTESPPNVVYFRPFKPFTLTSLTTKSPPSTRTTPVLTGPAKSDPFRPFSTIKPITTAQRFEAYNTGNFGQYVPYKPPSSVIDSGQYVPTPTLPTNSNFNFGIRTIPITPTKKYDPFKPFGSNVATYNPFMVFNTGRQHYPALTADSLQSPSSNELDFTPSFNLKRETETLKNQESSLASTSNSTVNLRISSTSKRETKATATRSVPTTKPTRSKSTSESIKVVTTKPTAKTLYHYTLAPTRARTTSIRSISTNSSLPTRSPVTTTKQSITSTTTSLTGVTRTTKPSRSSTTTRPSISPSRTAKPSSTITKKPPARLTTSSSQTKSLAPSSRPRSTIRATATVTRNTFQRSRTPLKVTRTPTRQTTLTTATSTSLISPTKPYKRPSESLFSTNLNIFDLYYKLYGVQPPNKTSSGVQHVTKTSQTNVVPTRTS